MKKSNFDVSQFSSSKRAFTLVEVVIVIFVLSVGLIVIMQGVTNTTRYISETAQRTIALNLAKEGIEAVYNIRNTNWRRRSSQRNACWLKVNPMVDTGNDGCQDDDWMREGWYVVSVETLPATSQKYYRIYPRERHDQLASNNLPKNKTWHQHYGWWDSGIYGQTFVQGDYAPIRKEKVSGSVLFYQGRAITAAEYMDLGLQEQDLDRRDGKYWRNMAVFGLYSKDDGSVKTCFRGSQDNCGDEKAKELRFCSTVWYVEPYQGMVNICAVMTNFLE